jgi:hypothetical protein
MKRLKLMVLFLYVLPNRVGFSCQMCKRSFFKLKLTQSILKSIMVTLYHQDRYRYHTRLYVLTLNWRFIFGALKRGWLLILALQTTFNVHYFFFVVLVLVINSLPYTAAIMIKINKNTRKSFTFCFSM